MTDLKYLAPLLAEMWSEVGLEILLEPVKA